MVITIEPGKTNYYFPFRASYRFTIVGIYVPPTAMFPKHYHNIGIRIEVSNFTIRLTFNY